MTSLYVTTFSFSEFDEYIDPTIAPRAKAALELAVEKGAIVRYDWIVDYHMGRCRIHMYTTTPRVDPDLIADHEVPLRLEH